MIEADCRQLPFRDGQFDMIFGSPPWDVPGLLGEARPELERVLSKHGIMVFLLPHGEDPRAASMIVTDRTWQHRQSFKVAKPSEKIGPRYHSPAEAFVAGVVSKYRPRRLLDPWCGVGTIPRTARRCGVRAVGCDLDRTALTIR